MTVQIRGLGVRIPPGLLFLGLTPTPQRIEGYPFGECVRASYATLLDLPIDLVPRFDPADLRPGERQQDRERRWLALLGYDLVEVPPARVSDVPPSARRRPHLLSGLSPRGLGHRCVGYQGAVLWDPHPSHAGLVTVWSVGFVVPRC